MGLRKPKDEVVVPADKTAKGSTDNSVVSEVEAGSAEVENEVDADADADGDGDGDAGTTEVVTAEKSSTSAVAGNPNTGMVAPQKGSYEAHLADEGFEGMVGGYYSSTHIKLDGEKFITSDDVELDGKKGFDVQLMESKAKFAYTNNVDDDECLFSYDKVHTTNGDLLSDVLAQWETQGKEVTVKQYADVVCGMVRDNGDGALDGDIVMLSIAPSSVAKMQGFMRKLSYRKMGLRETVVTITAGKRVIPKNPKNAFYPWAFAVAEKQEI